MNNVDKDSAAYRFGQMAGATFMLTGIAGLAYVVLILLAAGVLR